MRGELSDAARRKASDMLEKNYWAHFAPDGSTSPWGFIRQAGYNYQFAGENLAKGFTDSSSVVTAWMNSETHRANILSEKYKEIGFAIVPGTLQGEETVLIVQMFGTALGQSTASVPQSTAETEVKAHAENITPTAVPVIIAKAENSPTPAPSQTTVMTQIASENTSESKPAINASASARAASTLGLTLLVFGFVMDLVIVERKRIPRIVGHNLDHIMLIITFVIFLIVMKGGVVL
jgi:hypothetical protein